MTDLDKFEQSITTDDIREVLLEAKESNDE